MYYLQCTVVSCQKHLFYSIHCLFVKIVTFCHILKLNCLSKFRKIFIPLLIFFINFYSLCKKNVYGNITAVGDL